MERPRERHGGTVVLSAWIEWDGPAAGLRVRVIRVVDGRRSPVAAETSVDAVCAAVRDWLLELLTAAGPPEAQAPPDHRGDRCDGGGGRAPGTSERPDS
ncbi:hypothetical protein ABCR94_08945 [Streptomyces sp. 21So2-11]|uniref:hypothetical protein n=1 Tax=Streptomyces sp. 21So2-11 TaxID=3144408 RepID=UPI00321B4CD1